MAKQGPAVTSRAVRVRRAADVKTKNDNLRPDWNRDADCAFWLQLKERLMMRKLKQCVKLEGLFASLSAGRRPAVPVKVGLVFSTCLGNAAGVYHS